MLVVVRESSYEYAQLRERLFAVMDLVGGRRMGRGERVLVKPNLLSPARPEEAVLTHPLVVRAAVEYVLEVGGRPVVMDSPALGSFGRILREGGFADALRGLGVEAAPFAESATVDVGPPFGRIEVARAALECPWVLNLPKLKTHAQMLLTLGVKNLFGCVVGHRKPDWHLRLGVDGEMFARLLVTIHEVVKPAFTVLDGVLALEGQGPGKGGTPRPVGVLMASRDAYALDAAVCRLLSLPPEDLPTLRWARRLGHWRTEPEIDGDLPRVDNFALPRTEGLLVGPPAVQGLLRRHLTPRPVITAKRCENCRLCVEICPAGALSPGPDSPRIDYEACIRCYCCLEICPRGAVAKVEGPAARLFRLVTGK